MACTKLMSAPVCFIDTDENGKLFVRKEAKEILDSIRDPVVVVSVVGLYRTGKSYLMNRLAGQQSGFPLGSTIESKTKGIWMWCLSHPTKAGHTLVLLDTEGLGDVDKGDEKHDTWIFCLALLLSSTLVYNSLGVIDNMALEKLHYVTELREHIRVKSGASNEDDTADFMSVFPAFVWAVRDFTLELIKDDQPITSDEYLESGLTLKTGNSAQIEHFNLPRLCLRNFFAVRKCFVFPRPAGTKEMRRMETLTEAELDEEFLQQAETFCQYIYSSAQPKKISEGRAVTGTVLGNLAEVYVEAIRSGNVPCLENAVVSLAQIHNLRALEEALQLYMTEMFSSIQIPVDPKQLSDIHENAEKKAVEIFFSMCFNDTSQIDLSLDLMEKIQEEYEDLCQQNRELSVKQCQSVLNRVFEPFEKAVRNGSYVYPGGYREYREMFTLLAEEYRSQTRTQTQKVSEEVFNKYWKEKEEHGMVILAADESLTAAEKEKEVTRQNNNILKQKTWSLEKQNQLQMQMLQDQQRTHDEHVKQLTEKMEKEQERWRKDQEQVMEAKLQEKIQEEYEDLCQQNRELSVKQCQSVLNRVFEPFEKAVRNGSYVYPGGYREYREMFTLLAEEYRSQTRTQTQKVSEEVFDKYCKEKEESGMIILAADESLTAAEQEKEVTRQKNNILKKETGSLGKWNLLQMQMLQNLQRNHDEHVKQLTEKMEKEQEKRRKDQERLMEAKLKIDEVLSKYQEEMEESGMIILAADESLTAAEQEKKGEKLKTDILEQKQRILEEQDQPQQRMLEDKQRTHEEHVKQLTDKMEKEQERWRRDQEQVMEAKLREKEALLQEGFYQQTASMQRKIHRLEEEMRTKREKPTFHGLATLASLLSLKMFNRN